MGAYRDSDDYDGEIWVEPGPFTADRTVGDVGWTVSSSTASGCAGAVLDTGDFDGDGVTDLLASQPATTPNTNPFGAGVAYVLPGPFDADGAIEDAPSAWRAEGERDGAGWGLVAIGDTDGDGAEDFAASAIGRGSNDCAATCCARRWRRAGWSGSTTSMCASVSRNPGVTARRRSWSRPWNSWNAWWP